VTQADVDHGGIDNTATATATSPDGETVESPTSTAHVAIPGDSELLLEKSADTTFVTSAGTIVTYSFRVTNNSNMTLTDVTVEDVFVAPAGPALTVTCPTTTLAARGAEGDDMVCTASPYTVTQADMDNGAIDNTATARGATPAGTSVEDESSWHIEAEGPGTEEPTPTPAPSPPPGPFDGLAVTGASLLGGSAIALALGLIAAGLLMAVRRGRRV
jgi:uncharacterized repeat protein (TIGR01451 family)